MGRALLSAAKSTVAAIAVTAASCSHGSQNPNVLPPIMHRVMVNNDAVTAPQGSTLLDLLRWTASSTRLGQRGDGSDKQPLFVLDGFVVADALATLQNMPAAQVEFVALLRPLQAFRLYGEAASGGAIIVKTKLAR